MRNIFLFLFLFYSLTTAAQEEYVSTISSKQSNVVEVEHSGNWTSQCSTCPNSAVVADDGNSYVPTSAADMSNAANAGKTAYLTNSFSLASTTLAANQILVPNGGTITGENINLNGAEFVVNHNAAFSPWARFTSPYSGCLSPENFGASSASNDSDSIEAMIINAGYGYNQGATTYNMNTPKVFDETGRTFKWIGNNSVITSNYEAPGIYDFWLEFDQMRPEICDLEFDGANIVDNGIQMDNTDFYLENVYIHDFVGDADDERAIGLNVQYYSNTNDDIRIYNCKFDHFETPDDDQVGNAVGVTRGILMYLRETSNSNAIFDVQDTDFSSAYAEGEGVHIFATGNDYQDHDILFKFKNCNFWDNSRRDIKMQSSGLQIEGCTFTKIDSSSPWADEVTVNVGISLLDSPPTDQYHRNAIVRNCVFKAADGDANPISQFIGLTHVEGAIVEYNTFTFPSAHSYSAVLIDGKQVNNYVQNNTFFNCGIISANVADDGRAYVQNNSFEYRSFNGGWSTGIIRAASTPAVIRNITFSNNDILVDFVDSNSDDNFMGVIGTNNGWTLIDFYDMLIDSNNVTYIGANRTGVPFLHTDGNFGSTNTISNHVVTGITATGAFDVAGTDTFTNTNNEDENGNPLTKL